MLSVASLGASVWAAAVAGAAGSRDGAGRDAGTIINWCAGGRHLPPVDGGNRCGGRSAAKERRLSRRAWECGLAAVAVAQRCMAQQLE